MYATVAADDLCPTTEQLAAFHDGGLSGLEHRIVEAHLVICGDCREVLAAMVWMRADIAESCEE